MRETDKKVDDVGCFIWGSLFEIVKLSVFLFLWLYCGIPFWTLVLWGVCIGFAIGCIVVVYYILDSKKIRKHPSEGLNTEKESR